MNRRELYNHQGIRIDVNERDPESHDLYLGDNGNPAYFLLQRGILRDLAVRPDIEDISSALEQVSGGRINYELGERKIPVARVCLAMAQARIRELDQEVSYHADEANRLRAVSGQ